MPVVLLVAGVVAIWVALSRRMPWFARAAILVVGAALVVFPILMYVDFAFGQPTLQAIS